MPYSIDIGDHILGVFNSENKIENALKFLKMGYDNNELVMLLTSDISPLYIKKRIKKDWNITGSLSQNSIFVKSTSDWYSPGGVFDVNRVIKLWHKWISIAQRRGKKGVRVFADTSALFDSGLSTKLILYETMLENKFTIPLTAICAYNYDHLRPKSELVRKKLMNHHNKIWLAE